MNHDKTMVPLSFLEDLKKPPEPIVGSGDTAKFTYHDYVLTFDVNQDKFLKLPRDHNLEYVYFYKNQETKGIIKSDIKPCCILYPDYGWFHPDPNKGRLEYIGYSFKNLVNPELE